VIGDPAAMAKLLLGAEKRVSTVKAA